MKDINFVKDNSNMTDEYIDAEIICDNEDKYDLARIAHEINDSIDVELTDVGASYRPLYFSMLREDYAYLTDEEMHKVVEIIEENYLWEE